MNDFSFAAHFRPDLPEPAAPYGGLPPYNFVYGHNDPSLVPVAELAAAAERAVSRGGSRLALYHLGENPLGHPGLRAFIAGKVARRGIRANADDVLITTGSLQGLDLVNQILIQPGDTVIIEAFTYGAAINKVTRLGGHVAAAPMDSDGLDPDGLEHVLAGLQRRGVRPKYIHTIPTVQNPTGTVLSLERREALLALSRRFDVPIFEDECYADLQWEGEAPPALYAMDPTRVIHIGSLSKTLAPALRIGYAVAQWDVLSRMLACKIDAGSGALDQMIAAEYLENHFDQHVEELAGGLKRKLVVLIEAIEREFGTSVEIFRPKGGIFLWLRFPETVDVRDFQQEAFAAGVAFNPGPDWACDAEAAKSFMRLCYALPTEEQIDKGISILAAVCHEKTGVPERGANRLRPDGMASLSDTLQASLPANVHLCPSATKLTDAMRGGVVVCGSHGGRYPGFLAAEAGLRGVILCDAGIGLDQAGIASLPLLEPIGMPAATVTSTGCRIGDAEDMARRGVISFTNAVARDLGVRPGQTALEAAAIMSSAAVPIRRLDVMIGEGRSVLSRANGRNIVLIDSASLVEPQDAGQVIVTGSHGGLVGGVPALALQVDGHAAFFNDAGVGADEAGLARLAALDARRIAAVTVSAASARIGEARSTLEDGVVSFCNETAKRLGAARGMQAKQLAEQFADAK